MYPDLIIVITTRLLYNTFSWSLWNRFWHLWWTWYWKGDWWDSVPKSSHECKIQNH